MLLVDFRFLDGRHLLEPCKPLPAGRESVFAGGGTGRNQGDDFSHGNLPFSSEKQHVGKIPMFLHLGGDLCQIAFHIAVRFVGDIGSLS